MGLYQLFFGVSELGFEVFICCSYIEKIM